jgi:hypothetical protein
MSLLSPYAIIEKIDEQNFRRDKRTRAIKKVLVKSKAREPFTDGGATGALAIKQGWLKGIPVPTVKGVKSLGKIKTRVNKVGVGMDDVVHVIDRGEAKDIFSFIERVGFIGNRNNEMESFTATTIESSKTPEAHTMHVKKDTNSTCTKSIRFALEGSRKRCFTIGVNGKQLGQLTVAVDVKTDMAFVLYDRDPVDASSFPGYIHECVLIFNQLPRLSVKYMPDPHAPQLLDSPAQVTDLLNGLRLDNGIKKETQDYFDRRFPAFRYVLRNDPDETNDLAEDAYTAHISTLAQDIRKLHFTYAYLRAVAGILVRESVDYNQIQRQSIIDGIQKYVRVKSAVDPNNALELNPLHHLISEVAVAATLVGALLGDHATKNPATVNTEHVLKQVKQLWIEDPDVNAPKPAAVTILHFGQVLAINAWRTTDTFALTFEPKLQAQQDTYGHGISGNDWRIVFTETLQVKTLVNLKGCMAIQDTRFWAGKYDLFKDEPNTKPKTSRFLVRVQDKARMRFEITLHHPYKHLYGTTSH